MAIRALDLANVGVPDATTVDYDFLPILLDALAARGASYAAVNVHHQADVEAPSFGINPTTGDPDRPARRAADDARRDAHAHRRRAAMTDEGDRVYAHNLVVPLLGRQLNFNRGYHWVDVRLGSERFRFVNSHFEAFSCGRRHRPGGRDGAGDAPGRTVVVVCDCNTDPLDGAIKPIDALPHRTAYR